MTGDNPLREFLTSRRAAISPPQTGLPSSPTGRRVPGLRREEVAALAGISAAYYTKLERGRVGQVSDEVARAIEGALRLDPLERIHFRALLKNRAGRTATPAGPRVKARPALIATIHALDTPALVLGPRLDVLAANTAARTLIDDFDALPVKERNLARWTLLSRRARVVYPDWAMIAPQVAAQLRHLAVERAADPLMEQLVGEIMIASPEFARYWSQYRLNEHAYGAKKFFNETVGEFTLNYETLALPSDDGQSVIIYTADHGSPSEEKLRLLASWSAPAVASNAQRSASPPAGHRTGQDRA